MSWELLRLALEKLWHFLSLYVISKFYLLFKGCGSNVTGEFLEKLIEMYEKIRSVTHPTL